MVSNTPALVSLSLSFEKVMFAFLFFSVCFCQSVDTDGQGAVDKKLEMARSRCGLPLIGLAHGSGNDGMG
jgi:hypothetical protein